jgi:hypothetical protein
MKTGEADGNQNSTGGRAMHDQQPYARLHEIREASSSVAPHPLIHVYDQEVEVCFRSETYRVRDNGAVYRLARAGGMRRKLDEVWTFGNARKSTGYMAIANHIVHQIVATAFHPKPSKEHVVDHLDTNRMNNRADNLRWVTRLENVLLNPITRQRIIFAYGSLDAFFENPNRGTVPNIEWMRTVGKEEALECKKRLTRWAEKPQTPRDGRLGEWLFDSPSVELPQPKEPEDISSLTPLAFQRKWVTPTEFPLCPSEVVADALNEYVEWLSFAAVFARNQYGESVVVTADMGKDDVVSVLCRSASSVKDWAVAKVFIEDGKFCHENAGSFFTLQGALKGHCKIVGQPCEESIDDFC